jgi:DNA-binding transcriptional MerR regulator
MSDHKLLHGDAALAKMLAVCVSTIRTWREKRLIPFIKTGHRSISYSLPKVLEALENLTTLVKNETVDK